MIKSLTKIFKKAKPTPEQALEGLKIFAEVVKENKKITEIETTKREEILAIKEVEIKKIEAQKEILKTYFEGIFAERRYMIEEMFERLDKGIENNNAELIQLSMHSIVSIAKESPLKQVESLMNDFKNDEVKSISI